MTPQGTSYVSGASAHPLLGLTIGAQLDRTAERFPDNEALVVAHQDVRWRYGTLTEKVDAFAAGLLALGLEPGDRIGIWSPNNSEMGGNAVRRGEGRADPGQHQSRLSPGRTRIRAEQSRVPGALVTAEAFKSSRYIEMLRRLAPELDDARPGALKADEAATLWRRWCASDAETTAGMYNFAEVPGLAGAAERDRLRALADQLQFDDPINIQFTSGTTGFPKGATLSHHNILNNGYFNGVTLGLSERDRVCIPVPALSLLRHGDGQPDVGRLRCHHGLSRARPSTRWRCCARSRRSAARCSTACPPCSSPSSTIRSSRASTSRRFSTGTMAGSPCPIEVMRRVIGEMHMEEVTIAYGMTETSPVSFQSATDDPIERRVSTVGRVHPHVEVKVVNQDGRVVPSGVTAELLTRGYSVMRGYWNDEDKTRESHRRRGLDAHRRPGHHRRRRLLQHRWPHQGHGHPRRPRTSIRARSRNSSTATPRCRTCR